MKPYFATLPISEIGAALQEKKEKFYRYLSTSGRLDLYKRVYDQYYRAYRSGGKVYFTGEQGEYTNIDVNDFRNILLHLHVMTTDQRPAFEPRATNTDTESQAQTILARGLLDYYLSEKKLDRYIDKSTESAICYGDGYVGLDWNATAGEAYATDESGKVINNGDIEGAWFGPLEVVLDVHRKSSLDHDWRMTRSFKNKYTLAAKYAGGEDQASKELYERIVSMGSVGDDEGKSVFHQEKGQEDCDLVAVYTFYHEKTDALPQGRMTTWLSTEIVLNDGPLPFDKIPLYRMAPSEQDGTPFGYTIAFDLLPLQEALDKLCSIVMTNQATFGVGNVLVPNGANLSFQELADGLNAIGYTPGVGEPKALNLTNTPAEIFKMIDLIRSIMQTLSGVNSVARGEPEASLKSGSALALVQSMAIKFNSGLQRSYAELASDVGTGLIKILQTYARSKRISAIAGKSNRQYMKAWTGKDISNITRVICDLGNPLMRTSAGRLNLADTLLDSGKIETADQYLGVLVSGKLEPLIEGKQAELMNIRAENEMLSEGQEVIAVVTDAHALHIQEHKVVLSSPDARKNPVLVEATLLHIQDHINQLKTGDPDVLMILGQKPLAPPQAPLPPPNLPAEGGEVVDMGQPMTSAGVPEPRLPAMPKNALTGEQFEPSNGGMQ